MEIFCVETFMNRVDKASSATELADLQIELALHSQSLSEPDRKILVDDYMNRLKSRRRRISATLTDMEKVTV